MNSLELIRPFGPVIGKTSISEEHRLAILKLCKIARTPANEGLVGYIHEEYELKSELRSFLPILTKMAHEYLTAVNWTINEAIVPELQDVQCTNIWLNVYKKGEFNRIHNHRGNDVACVIFVDVDIKGKCPYVTREGDKEVNIPGSLIFYHGEALNGIGSRMFLVEPKPGDVYFFPADMLHTTTPCWGDDDVRTSIAGNFIVKRKIEA